MLFKGYNSRKPLKWKNLDTCKILLWPKRKNHVCTNIVQHYMYRQLCEMPFPQINFWKKVSWEDEYMYNLFKAFKDLPVNSLFFKNSGESLSECWGPPRLCLDSNLDGLHRTQGNVGEELSRCTGYQIQGCPPQESIFLDEV